MAKRNPYSRWRRLPPVFRSGEHKLPGPNEEPQRIIIYLPGAVLDQAEVLAGKAGVPTIQEYCAGLLGRAIEVERVKAHMVEVEVKRGPLEGFNEVTGDPDYLAEWHEQSESRETAAGRPQPPSSSGVEAIPASPISTGASGRVMHPAGGCRPGRRQRPFERRLFARPQARRIAREGAGPHRTGAAGDRAGHHGKDRTRSDGWNSPRGRPVPRGTGRS